jgi:hypothetical protein
MEFGLRMVKGKDGAGGREAEQINKWTCRSAKEVVLYSVAMEIH